MRFLLLIVILTVIVSISTARLLLRGRSRDGNLAEPVLSREYVLPEEKWFTQLVDHFNPTDLKVWKQRYFVNSDFYKPNGPVFLMIGGENSINAKWMVEGQWIEYAKEFNAMCFFLEHRYFGKSHPTSDITTHNLVFLSSETSVQDIAYFIENMNIEYKFSNETKWIVFGGSYAGSLAAWMRVKYPYLVHGAVSSSAPLLAQVDFQEYYVVVEESLKQHSQECVNTLKEANTQIHSMLRHANFQKEISEKFRLCDPIDPGFTTQSDISNLYETLASNLAGIVQYNKDNRWSSQISNITVDDVCNILTDKSKGPVDSLAHINSMILNATKEKCLDYSYGKMIHELRNTSWTSEQAEGGRQWMYLTCTQFGFFQTSTARPELFSETFPVDFFVQQCIDIFGPKYNMDVVKSAVIRTNVLFGGLHLQVPNTVFVHGSLDPWHALGITRSPNPQVPAIYIQGTAHCADMYPPSEKDLPQLQQARITIKGLIEKWLKN